ADHAHGERCHPSAAEDRGGTRRQAWTPREQVLQSVGPLTRRQAARLSGRRHWTIPTFSPRVVRTRIETHSQYGVCNDAVLLTRRRVDRLLACGGGGPPPQRRRGGGAARAHTLSPP